MPTIIGYGTSAGDYCLSCSKNIHPSSAKVAIVRGEANIESCRGCGAFVQAA